MWNYLLEDPAQSVNIAFKKAFRSVIDETEDLQKRNFTPLHLTVLGFSRVALDAMLELTTVDIDARCSLGRTPLCWAALRQDSKPVQILIDKGATLHLADCRGQNPFHFAAETGSIESLQILLEAVAKTDGHFSRNCQRSWDQEKDKLNTKERETKMSSYWRDLVEAKDYKGRTPLHFATRRNQFAHAQLLLLYNARIDSPDSVLGRTPLHMAIYWNHHRITRLLIESGARTDINDADGATVLHYAAKFGDITTLAILNNAQSHIISSDVRDANGLTCFDAFDQFRREVLREDEQTFQIARCRFERLSACGKQSMHPDGSDCTDVESKAEEKRN